MKFSLMALLFFTSSFSFGQRHTRNIAWVTPAVDTKINGLAAGFFMAPFLKEVDSMESVTAINGVNIEIAGYGILMGLAPQHPLYGDHNSIDRNDLDSVIMNWQRYYKYRANGIVLSGTGSFAPDMIMNGINLGGFAVEHAKSNGISAALAIHMTAITNGVSAACLFNHSVQSKGVQIGLFNKTKRLRGFQVGLINVNERRTIPIINWNFGRSGRKSATANRI